MTDQMITALVILHPGLDPHADTVRAGETPPNPAAVDRVVGWFLASGFLTGPVVGISFSITGPEQLFADVFGDPLLSDEPGGETRYDAARMDEEVSALVASIATVPPPEFGPLNP